MAREDPKLVALKAVPLFDGMSKKDLAAVARIADGLDLPAGKVLIEEDRLGSQFFVLLDGEADVRRRGRKVNTLGKGDFFGEIALLADRRTTATVTSRTPVRVLVITRASFSKLLRDLPDVRWTVMQALVRRVPGDGILSSD
ncbi:MAG TPA: cyclic nucleotide-binding domain-containing protein [Gaiellaceae bacterium]|nr:cyclic nucleotide-binding domain-containing protein [Gaiellaceae bacterium]